MKVIKPGLKEIKKIYYKKTCSYCKAEFEFEESEADVVARQDVPRKASSITGLEMLKEIINGQVTCPCCDTQNKFTQDDIIKEETIMKEFLDKGFKKLSDYIYMPTKDGIKVDDRTNIFDYSEYDRFYKCNEYKFNDYIDRCAHCPNVMKKLDMNYVGDTPCVTCSNNPWKVTCNSATSTKTKSSKSSK